MQECAVQILLGILKQVLNKSVIEKYEADLLALLRDAVSAAPEVLKSAEAAIIGHLYDLAKKTDNTVDDRAVAAIAEALGVTLPAAAATPA